MVGAAGDGSRDRGTGGRLGVGRAAGARVRPAAGSPPLHGVPRLPLHRPPRRERHHVSPPARGRRGRSYKPSTTTTATAWSWPTSTATARSTSTSSTSSARTSCGRTWAAASFRDVTAEAGVGLPDRLSVTASFADVDNDGDPDLFVTTVRMGNCLFRNDGKGRFRDVTAEVGLGYTGHSSGAVVLRLRPRRPARPLPRQRRQLHHRHPNARGLLHGTRLVGSIRARAVAYQRLLGHLHDERTETSILYRNLGNRFEDVSQAPGCSTTSWSGDASFVDFDGDSLARPLRPQHAGRQPLLGERRRQAPSSSATAEVLPQDPVGHHGHQVLRLRQRRLIGPPPHRHALRHVRDVTPRHEKLKSLVELHRPRAPGRGQQHLRQRVLREPGRRAIRRGLRRAGRRELLAVGSRASATSTPTAGRTSSSPPA